MSIPVARRTVSKISPKLQTQKIKVSIEKKLDQKPIINEFGAEEIMDLESQSQSGLRHQ